MEKEVFPSEIQREGLYVLGHHGGPTCTAPLIRLGFVNGVLTHVDGMPRKNCTGLEAQGSATLTTAFAYRAGYVLHWVPGAGWRYDAPVVAEPKPEPAPRKKYARDRR